MLCNGPQIESSVKTPQGKECYIVYINYLIKAYDKNDFLLCKETLELYAVVNGLVMETNLFTSIEPMDLEQGKHIQNLKDKPLWIWRTGQTSWKAGKTHTVT